MSSELLPPREGRKEAVQPDDTFSRKLSVSDNSHLKRNINSIIDSLDVLNARQRQ